MRRTFAILAALVLAAALLVGCGGDDDTPSADAGELLAEAFSTPVESGKLNATAKLQADGVDELDDGIELRVSGAFTRDGADLDATVTGLIPGLGGNLTFTRDNIWISFAGRAFELGEELTGELLGHVRERGGDAGEGLTPKALGLDIERWLRDARVDGEDEIEGAEVTKVVAAIDPAAIAADLPKLADEVGRELPGRHAELLEQLIDEASVEVYVAKADDTIRRLVLDLSFEVPEGQRDLLGGAEDGAFSLDVTLADVGEPQKIEPPADARPISELLQMFGLGPELLRR